MVFGGPPAATPPYKKVAWLFGKSVKFVKTRWPPKPFGDNHEENFIEVRWRLPIGALDRSGSSAGVNKGSAVADILLKVAPPGSLSNAVISSVTNGLATVINFLSGGRGLSQSSNAALVSLSTAGSTKFNKSYPQGIPTTACGAGAASVNGVAYFSWSGAQPYTNVLDILDPALALTSLAFGGAKNDGLVSSCSSHLGTVIRDDYAMNHLDEVNQTVGLVNLFETSPVTVFRQQANRLKNMGL